ncbi:MAG TPA: APC family permease [Actinoplanes sp.]|nr:APC family permease [Actinoplanes sp.]
MSESTLEPGAVGVTGSMAMSLGVMNPASGMMFTAAVVAGYAGPAVPLVYLLSLAGVALLVNTIAEFSRRLAHAGSFYAFNTAGFGPVFGFFAGWLLFAAYLYPQNLLVFGAFASTALGVHLGLQVPWWIFTIAAAVTIWALSMRGIKASTRSYLALEIFGILTVLTVVVAIVVQGGATGDLWDAKLIDPSANPDQWGGIFFGMIFGVMSFAGFEAVATLGEETSDARRNIPRAMWLAVIGAGIFFIVTSSAMTLGFGVDRAADFASSAAPMSHLAGVYGNQALVLGVDVAAVLVAFAVGLSIHNAAARVTFAMGRDGFLPRSLGRTHPRLMTPYVAISAIGALSLGLALTVGLSTAPYPDGYAYFGTFSTLPVIMVYIITSLALVRFVRVNDPGGFSLVRHALFPLLGMALMALPIYGSFWPWPAWPANLIIALSFAWMLVGLVIGYRLRSRAGELLQRVGRMLAS